MTRTNDEKNRHDFANELGVILGSSELMLAKTARSDPQHADLEEIHEAVRVAVDLLERAFPVRADPLR